MHNIDNVEISIEDDITYHNLIDDSPYYSVGVFFMRKGASIPIHDHINLLVFSKTLFGSLEITSYDKIDTNISNSNFFEVKITENIIYKSGEVSVLTPSHKNYHQITAVEDSALFDVLIPDYGSNDCNYYKVSRLLDKYYFKKIKS